LQHRPRPHAEEDRREDRRHDVSAVQGAHRCFVLARTDYENSDDARDEAERPRDEREDDACDPEKRKEDDAKDHRTDVLRGGRLEEVCPAARTVSDVVPDQIRDDGGISRVVLRDSRLHLADEVSPHICRLRVDAAAKLCEQRDEARPEP